MTAKELIEILAQFDEDTKVVFAYPSQDYLHTVLAGTIDDVELGQIKWSDYHDKNAVVDSDDFDEEDDENVVIVLS